MLRWAAIFLVIALVAGLLGFAGHSHVIRATRFSGTVHYAAHDPAATTITITILTDGLAVLTPPDTAEIRKVTASMRDDVLHVAQYPEIRFTSTHVKPAGSGYEVTATLTMHGTTREITVPVAVEFQGDTLVARGRFSVKQTDYGIRPFRGGPGGTVRVTVRYPQGKLSAVTATTGVMLTAGAHFYRRAWAGIRAASWPTRAN